MLQYTNRWALGTSSFNGFWLVHYGSNGFHGMNITSLPADASSAGLPDPDQSGGSHVVIYDGHCNFCRTQVRNLRRLDCCGGKLSFLSLHDPRVADRYPDLSHDQLMQQMYVIDPSGKAYGGADAIRLLSRRLPLLWLAAPILHFPGTARLWRWMYNQVAKRRYRLAGQSCEGDTCSIHLNRKS
jgi:predicted DCC family thiol-disulfide oxidoreductase YuxK